MRSDDVIANRPHTNPRIALIAGEASGDELGAGLIAELRKQYPDAEFAGVGGHRMRDAGLDAWSDYAPLAVMGLAEVLRHLPRLLRFRRDLVQRLQAWQPDVVIGIDAPDFNLGVEKRLKQAGTATVHYVSPSVWAWRQKRAARIGESADRVLCLFPMEPPIYARYGADARFVGHPLADRFTTVEAPADSRRALRVEDSAEVLAVLPGSRLSEIRRLAPVFLEVAHRLQQLRPNLVVLVPAANDACRRALDEELKRIARTHGQHGGASIRLINGRSHEVLLAADVVLLASGTAALEAALARRPMVVGYRIASLTHFLIKLMGLLKIERFSLPNVLADKLLVPEFMQSDCTAEAITPAIQELFESDAARQRQLDGFESIRHALRAPGGASHAAAKAITDLVEATRTAQIDAKECE